MRALERSARRRSAGPKMLQFKSRSRKFCVLSLRAGCWPLFVVAFSILSNFSSSTTSTPGRIRRSNCLETHRSHCTDQGDWPVNRLTCGSPGNVANSRETRTKSAHDANGTACRRSLIHSSRLRSFGPNSPSGRVVVRLSCVHIPVHSKSNRASSTSGQSTNAAASSTTIKKRCVQVTRWLW